MLRCVPGGTSLAGSRGGGKCSVGDTDECGHSLLAASRGEKEKFGAWGTLTVSTALVSWDTLETFLKCSALGHTDRLIVTLVP